MAMTAQEVASVNGPIYQDFQLLGRQMRSTYSKDPQTMVQYAGYVDAFADRISKYQSGAIYNSSGLIAACKGPFCHKWTCDNIISQYHMYGDKSKWMTACIQAIQDFVPIAENPRLLADAASVLSSIGSASHHQQQQQREPINIPQQQRQTLNRQQQQREPINMPQQQRQTLNRLPRPRQQHRQHQQQHRQSQQHTRPQQQHQYQQRQTINRSSLSQTQQYQREPLQYQQRPHTQYRQQPHTQYQQQPHTQYQTPSQRLQQYRGGINVSGGGINVSGGNNGSGALPGISSSVRAAVQDVVQNRRKRRRRDAGVPRQKRSTEAVLLSATRSFIIFNKARQYLYLVASLEASFEEIPPQHRVGKEIFDVCGNADVNALGRLIFGWEPAPRRYSIGPATARFLTKGDWRVFKPAFQHIRRHITTLVTSDHKKAAKDYILNILNNDNNNSVSDNNDNMDDMGNVNSNNNINSMENIENENNNNIHEMGNVNNDNNINDMENIENENNNNIHETGNVNNNNNINDMENIVNGNNNNTNEIGNVNNNNNINAMENIVNGNNNDSSSGYGPIRGQGHATHQTFAPF